MNAKDLERYRKEYPLPPPTTGLVGHSRVWVVGAEVARVVHALCDEVQRLQASEASLRCRCAMVAGLEGRRRVEEQPPPIRVVDDFGDAIHDTPAE